jgi:hypothetical protein
MPDDGQGEFSGGASVNWLIDVDNGDLPLTQPKEPGNNKRYKVTRIDRPPKEDPKDRYFFVTVDGAKCIGVKGSKVVLKVPATKGPDITVQWVYTAAEVNKKFGERALDVDLAALVSKASRESGV